MTVFRTEVRSGVYHDSIVLMQLQAALAKLPGVRDAAAVMGTEENLELLSATGLHPGSGSGLDPDQSGPDDLVIVVQADDVGAAIGALARVDELLARRGAGETGEFQPRSLDSAIKRLPSARWALVSVPGRFAASVARDALARGLHVFMYSDNVERADEVALKREAASRGLLLMGPDCGTAIINGTGLGFANRVRRGAIGLVGASGTGLQAISSRIHALGAGVSHALGTGGRDLHADVGAITARQALRLLARDPETEVIVLVSKPPDPKVADALLSEASETGKPVIVHFLDDPPPCTVRDLSQVRVATTLAECADLAVGLAGSGALDRARPHPEDTAPEQREPTPALQGSRYLRGLFAGGTLALEATRVARSLLPSVQCNVSLEGGSNRADPTGGSGHTIVDMGSDEFTVGRLHPMMDNELRVRQIAREAADPETGVVLLDVVLGDGAHPDPAAELAPAIEAARSETDIEFVLIVIGTENDPQDLEAQIDRLTEAGAVVFTDTSEAVRFAAHRLGAAGNRMTPENSTTPAGAREPTAAGAPGAPSPEPPTDAWPSIEGVPPDVDPEVLRAPVTAINVGVRIFCDSLLDQGAAAVHVDWRPPAGGDEKLVSILERLKG